MKRLTLVACLGLLALLSARRAFADAGPPLQPPGSNIAAGGQTQVQMLAEKVVLEVTPPDGVRVGADFTMRNLGTAAEQMQVRFPLENPQSPLSPLSLSAETDQLLCNPHLYFRFGGTHCRDRRE